MTTQSYPELRFISVTDLEDVLLEIIRIREEDVTEFANLSNIYLPGRSTGRVPSSNSDVLATDQEGDVVNDGTYEYKLIDDSGTLKWDRRTLDIAW